MENFSIVGNWLLDQEVARDIAGVSGLVRQNLKQGACEFKTVKSRQ